MTNTIKALNAYGTYEFRDESSYPLPRAQRALSGRTHYVDDATLKAFKSRILRSTSSKSGLYFILQESLPYGGFNEPRQRRNFVFNVFGSIVRGRDTAFKSAKLADNEYSDLLAWMDSPEAEQATIDALKLAIQRDQRKIAEALNLLDEVTA